MSDWLDPSTINLYYSFLMACQHRNVVFSESLKIFHVSVMIVVRPIHLLVKYRSKAALIYPLHALLLFVPCTECKLTYVEFEMRGDFMRKIELTVGLRRSRDTGVQVLNV